MKTNLSRLMILLAVFALSVSAVFAQEEVPAQVNTFTFVLVIIGGGIGIVAILGAAMWAANKENEPKSE